ncbi:hypothetical protein W97_04995 [Coniosporium apollinis CBS 100218]|uniref:Uncharacterized protein n=1 Tax=Coniosporium apollinis (strain CBS 100218) TaxID=1168221 RepID=R7YVR9_CONA1|nr:uncharacterized protein W97_04995 [Coniosporium apollinis CBS 100218]EON65756.1 hypothetical protein W97_04995 [Coniosporium apollinis CBS 100218]
MASICSFESFNSRFFPELGELPLPPRSRHEPSSAAVEASKVVDLGSNSESESDEETATADSVNDRGILPSRRCEVCFDSEQDEQYRAALKFLLQDDCGKRVRLSITVRGKIWPANERLPDRELWHIQTSGHIKREAKFFRAPYTFQGDGRPYAEFERMFEEFKTNPPNRRRRHRGHNTSTRVPRTESRVAAVRNFTAINRPRAITMPPTPPQSSPSQGLASSPTSPRRRKRRAEDDEDSDLEIMHERKSSRVEVDFERAQLSERIKERRQLARLTEIVSEMQAALALLVNATSSPRGREIDTGKTGSAAVVEGAQSGHARSPDLQSPVAGPSRNACPSPGPPHPQRQAGNSTEKDPRPELDSAGSPPIRDARLSSGKAATYNTPTVNESSATSTHGSACNCSRTMPLEYLREDLPPLKECERRGMISEHWQNIERLARCNYHKSTVLGKGCIAALDLKLISPKSVEALTKRRNKPPAPGSQKSCSQQFAGK